MTDTQRLRELAESEGLPARSTDMDKTVICFDGWWSAEEFADYPEPWERFTVIVFGRETGDNRTAVPFDLERAGFVPKAALAAVEAENGRLRKALGMAEHERDEARGEVAELLARLDAAAFGAHRVIKALQRARAAAVDGG